MRISEYDVHTGKMESLEWKILKILDWKARMENEQFEQKGDEAAGSGSHTTKFWTFNSDQTQTKHRLKA